MSVLTKIAEHVYWMPPAPPDRPSLSGVVGSRRTLMLDAGSSAAHARAFLSALLTESGTRPERCDLYVEGHHELVSSRGDMEGLFEKMRLAEGAVREGSAIAAPDEETEYFFRAFKAGHSLAR